MTLIKNQRGVGSVKAAGAFLFEMEISFRYCIDIRKERHISIEPPI